MLPAPPAAKKRKTAPASKEEPKDEEEEAEGEEDEEAVPVEDEEEDEDGEAEAEEPTEKTSKCGGPAAAAKSAKGGVVPKESDLEEVKGDDEEEE